MRVKCIKCGAKAAVTSRNEITSQVVDLYCACTNPQCRHTFVSRLVYSHSLSPSALERQECGAEAAAG